MKITSIAVTPVQVPMEFSYGELEGVPAVVAQVQTD